MKTIKEHSEYYCITRKTFKKHAGEILSSYNFGDHFIDHLIYVVQEKENSDVSVKFIRTLIGLFGAINTGRASGLAKHEVSSLTLKQFLDLIEFLYYNDMYIMDEIASYLNERFVVDIIE